MQYLRTLILGSLSLACLIGCISAPKAPNLSSDKPSASRPVDTGSFAWGISASSYQYEDPAVQPGEKGYFQTDWDKMVAKGGAPEKGNALYSWSDWPKDLAALRKIGVTHYRFSIEWARVEPQPGKYQEEVIQKYVDMARRLKAAGIEPVVCLWHFTFPDWLSEDNKPATANWLHPQAAERWRAYVAKMVRAMGTTVRFYAPQNEPNGQITTAYLGGMWPPRQTLNFNLYWKAVRASAAQFREAAAIIRQHRPGAVVMTVEATPLWKRGFLDPTGAFYHAMLNNNYDHLDLVYDTADVIGFNYYYSQAASPVSALTIPYRRGHNYTMMGWDIDPEGLYQQIKILAKRYGKPLMVTENGIATVRDSKRVRYIREHIAALEKAKAEGYDVRGYFYWSLADNYEWHYGYDATFGLSHMDPQTKERILRPSALYYRDWIRQQRKIKP